jgi:hypothetical protein
MIIGAVAGQFNHRNNICQIYEQEMQSEEYEMQTAPNQIDILFDTLITARYHKQESKRRKR